ncbi:MAG: STAS domain-containing protein [Phycisphaerae bacterium]
MDELIIQSERRGDVHVLRIRGELRDDAPTALVEAVSEHIATRGTRIVLDLSGVSFLGSAGLGALVRVVAQGNAQECQIILAEPTPMVLGVLQVTKLDKFFRVSASVDNAVAVLS